MGGREYSGSIYGVSSRGWYARQDWTGLDWTDGWFGFMRCGYQIMIFKNCSRCSSAFS